MIKIKRVYETIAEEDGMRFLVERLWPRGIKREKLQIQDWLKEVSPSPALRKWYSHDVSKWKEFRRRYQVELEANPPACKPLIEAARRGNITLLYSARDLEHNSALVLKEVLETKL